MKLGWAKDWFENVLLDNIMEENTRRVEDRVSGLVEELVGSIVTEAGKRSSARSVRLEMARVLKGKAMAISTRRREAEEKKNRLLIKLEQMWNDLEEEGKKEMMENLENQKIKRIQNRKRKRGNSRTEKKILREELDSRRMATGVADRILEEILGMVRIEHDCGTAQACPSWQCEKAYRVQLLETELDKINT